MRGRACLAALLVATTCGCATTQETVGAVVMGGGALTAGMGVGLSMDGHPKGQPDVVTRRADPSVGIPVAMAGAALLVAGFVIYITAPHEHAKKDN